MWNFLNKITIIVLYSRDKILTHQNLFQIKKAWTAFRKHGWFFYPSHNLIFCNCFVFLFPCSFTETTPLTYFLFSIRIPYLHYNLNLTVAISRLFSSIPLNISQNQASMKHSTCSLVFYTEVNDNTRNQWHKKADRIPKKWYWIL